MNVQNRERQCILKQKKKLKLRKLHIAYPEVILICKMHGLEHSIYFLSKGCDQCHILYII